MRPAYEIKTKMRWLNFAVSAKFSWPDEPVEIPFDGRIVVLQPLSEELSCTVSLYDENGTTFEEGGTILSQFLSYLSWSKNEGVEELFAIGTNMPDAPGRLGRGSYPFSCWGNVKPWDFLYIPRPSSEQAKLALAIYREGLVLNSASLRFLSFFKVLNITHSNGKAQIKWINNSLIHIKYGRELERLKELRKAHRDIGDYLYVQGRCAIAHAYSSPLVNPDVYCDRRRMEDDLPLIKELASIFIERELGVVSEGAAMKEKYEQCVANQEFFVPKKEHGKRIRYVLYSHA